MFETIRDFHALAAAHTQSLQSVSGLNGEEEAHFQSLSNADHAGVVGHGGSNAAAIGDHYQCNFAVNFDSYTYGSSNFENPLAQAEVQKSTDPEARWGWVLKPRLSPIVPKGLKPGASKAKKIRESVA